MNRRDAEGAEKERVSELEEGLNRLTEAVIGAAIEVHRVLGPGFLESFYEQALCLEMTRRRIPFVRQHVFPVFYKGVRIGESRIDLLVDDRLVVELKVTDHYAPIHVAQVLSYLKATRLPLGLLINFNVRFLCEGVRRVIQTPSPSASSASLR